jgi:hypothetical protein
LKNNDGLHLNEFYHYCTVVGDNKRCEDVQTFENREIIFKIYDLDEDTLTNLSSFRVNLIDSTINELKHYFPTEDFSSLEIFEPEMLPTNASNVPSFGVTELNETCVMLELANKFEDIRNQFTDLLYQIIYSEFSKNRRCSRLQDF